MKKYKPIYTILLSSISLMLCAFQCGEDVVEPEQSEVPTMLLKVTPNKKEYKIGDTLWITSDVSSKVLSFITNESILYEASDAILYFYKLKHPQDVKDYYADFAVSDFEIIKIIGTAEKEVYSSKYNSENYTYWDNLHRLLKPELTNEKERYKLKIGIIPKTTGCFALYCQNGFDIINNNEELFYSYFKNKYNTLFVKTRYESIWLYIDFRIYFFNVA